MALLPLWVAGAALALSVAFVCVLLCGQSETFRHGPLGRVHAWLTVRLPRALAAGLRRVCGARVANAASSCIDYTTNQRNPFLQLFFLGLLLGGIAAFCYSALPYVLDPAHRYVHPLHRLVIPLAIGASLLSFYLACRSDPGELTARNLRRAMDRYPVDYVIYVPKECGTCKIPRPARSKHCSLCNKCVARYDHRMQRLIAGTHSSGGSTLTHAATARWCFRDPHQIAHGSTIAWAPTTCATFWRS